MSAKDKLQERRASSNYGRVKVELTPDDEIRQLHEAYQFLLKKFNLGELQEEKVSIVSPFMQMTLDNDEDWKLAKQKVEDEEAAAAEIEAETKENGTEATNGFHETNGHTEEIDEIKAYEIEEKKKAEEAASKLANVTMNGLLTEPEDKGPKRQRSIKRKKSLKAESEEPQSIDGLLSAEPEEVKGFKKQRSFKRKSMIVGMLGSSSKTPEPDAGLLAAEPEKPKSAVKRRSLRRKSARY